MLHHRLPRLYDDLDLDERISASELEEQLEDPYNRFGRPIMETIEWSNTDLENSVAELKAYLRDLNQHTKGADDNEWKVRFESQIVLNKQLQERKEWLETELKETKRKFTTGTYPEALNFNLDALNEPELLRLVKHLEKMRNNLYSNLRDTEWKLDKETKEFHNLDEMRRVYRADLKHSSQLDLDPMSPIYPPGYFSYLDIYGRNGSSSLPRLPSNKKGAVPAAGASANIKVKGKNRSQSQPPPPRNKSRNEKNTVKIETSVTSNGNMTDDLSIEEQDTIN